mgnify:CR=1 FL=1
MDMLATTHRSALIGLICVLACIAKSFGQPVFTILLDHRDSTSFAASTGTVSTADFGSAVREGGDGTVFWLTRSLTPFTGGAYIEHSRVLKVWQSGLVEELLLIDTTSQGREPLVDFSLIGDSMVILAGLSTFTASSSLNNGKGWIRKMGLQGGGIRNAVIDLGGDTRVLDVAYREDSADVLASGMSIDSTGQYIGFIGCWTMDLDLKWMTVLDTFLAQDVNSIEIGPSGAIYGYMDVNTDLSLLSTLMFTLCRLRPNGELDWVQEYHTPNMERGPAYTHLAVSPDEELFVAGQLRVTGTDLGMGKIIKVDSTGQLLDEFEFDRGPFSDHFTVVRHVAPNKILVGGDTHDYSYLPEDQFIVQWMLLDEDLNPIWHRTYDPLPDLDQGDAYMLNGDLHSDGSFLFTGFITSSPLIGPTGDPRSNDAWLVKTDSCGFTEGHVPDPSFSVDSVNGLTVYVSLDSTWFCTASIVMGDSVYTTHVNQLDPPLSFSHTFDSVGVHVIESRVMGANLTRSQFRTVQIGTDTTGLLRRMEPFHFQITPNPAPVETTIEVRNTLGHVGEELTLQVLDLNGRVITERSRRIDGSMPRFTLQTAAWSRGVYVVQARVGGQVLGVGKVVR